MPSADAVNSLIVEGAWFYLLFRQNRPVVETDLLYYIMFPHLHMNVMHIFDTLHFCNSAQCLLISALTLSNIAT